MTSTVGIKATFAILPSGTGVFENEDVRCSMSSLQSWGSSDAVNGIASVFGMGIAVKLA